MPVRTPGRLDAGDGGHRVVVRHLVAGGATDAIGFLIGLDEHTITVRTRSADERIPLADVVAAKRVPLRPAVRRGARRADETVAPAALHALMTPGLPPLHSARLGGWLLRASEGFTHRGNSLLVLGPADRPDEPALLAAKSWYAAKGLPLIIQEYPGGCVGPALAVGTVDPGDTLVMTAYSADVLAASSDARPAGLHTSTSPEPAWWAGVSERERSHRDVFGRMLAGGRGAAGYHWAERNGTVVGAARSVADRGWAGIAGVFVHPGNRHQGWATALLAAAAEHALANAALRLYMQVAADNQPAVTLYQRLGFTEHHRYRYRRLN